MKTCKTCIFFQPEVVDVNCSDWVCIKLSGKDNYAELIDKTGIEVFPICQHDGLGYYFYVKEWFGCVHHQIRKEK